MARSPENSPGGRSRDPTDEQRWDRYRHQRDGFLPPLHPADPGAGQPSDPVINAIIIGCASSGVVIVLLEGLFG